MMKEKQTMKTRIIELIETWELKGLGTEEHPYRRVKQLWTKEGKLVHEFDGETNDERKD